MKKIYFLLLIISFLLISCGHEHTYNSGEITSQPTCTETGVKTYTCTICGKTKTESVDKVEHQYSPGEILTQATCYEEGQRKLTCSVCGAVSLETIPKTQHKYDEKVLKEPTFTEEGEKQYTCSTCGDTYKEVIPIRDDEVVVTVTEKNSLPVDYNESRYSERVDMTFNVENMTDKDIKGVQGELKISDMFGEQIMVIETDFTGKIIPSKGVAEYNLGFDVNQFMDSHVKVYTTNLEDLLFDYSISNVIYADGESKNGSVSAKSLTKSDEVEIIVTSKTSLPANYNVGRYSPWIDFSFELNNKTDKDIRGIQGVLTIKDLFGEDIKSFNCDFTGMTVPAGGTIEKTGLGIDVNQFMDEDVKIYTEEFEDLNFEYEVKSIVYN